MTDHSVSNPQARRTRNRRKTKSKIHASKEWKENVKLFVSGKKCEWCGSTAKLLPHHPYQDTPNEIYGDLVLSGCIVLCSKCHFQYERRHKQLCPRCKVHWMPLKGVETCRSCDLELYPKKKDEQDARKEKSKLEDRQRKDDRNAKNRALKRKHPCVFRRISGACGLSILRSQCMYAQTKAELKCMDFKKKRGAK